MGVFGSSYPSSKLSNISTKCTDPNTAPTPSPSTPSFDYIIVGGGPAGCVLANRLATSLPNRTILLLERGQVADTFQSRVPLLSLAYARSDPGVMKYDSAPQKNINDRRMTMISGKLLGGTTRVNNGLYSRCPAAEFDGWGHGWEYEALKKLYDKSEKKVENTKQSTPEGEWSTRIVPPFFKSSEIFRQVIQETGVPFIKDINTSPPSLPILTKLRTTVTKAGHRSSASYAFLPVSFLQRHRNLTICFDAVVQKVQISLLRGRKIVEGVFVENENEGQGRGGKGGKGGKGDRWFIRGGEVVLCAGAVGSAQLLILSGIGATEEVQKLGIETKVDLPGVGKHLQDHISVPLCYKVPISDSIHALQSPPYFFAIKSLIQYLIHGTGIFISPVTEYTYFLHSNRYPPQITLSEPAPVPAEIVSSSETSTPEPPPNPSRTETSNTPDPSTLADLELAWIGAWGTAEDPVPPLGKQGYNTLLVQLPRPESKGTITVTSLDARIPPLVDPNYLAHPRDLETLRRGVIIGMALGRKMMEKYPMTEILVPQIPGTSKTVDSTKISPVGMSGSGDMSPGLDTEVVERIDEFVKSKVSGAYHLSSTCRMAPRMHGGVVDQDLKVYGVEGLRVADASVFPRLVGMKPQATIVLVGEKCAELILGGK